MDGKSLSITFIMFENFSFVIPYIIMNKKKEFTYPAAVIDEQRPGEMGKEAHWQTNADREMSGENRYRISCLT